MCQKVQFPATPEEKPPGQRIDNTEWDSRTRLLATFIEPGTTVLEFGCGRQVLRHILHPSCTYIPSDIESRSEDTWVCDLNAPTLPIMPASDVAVFGGVLEYIHDLPRLFEHLRGYTDALVFSYAPVPTYALPGQPEDESQMAYVRERRELKGWVNHLDHRAINGALLEAGWLFHRAEHWEFYQEIYRYVKA